MCPDAEAWEAGISNSQKTVPPKKAKEIFHEAKVPRFESKEIALGVRAAQNTRKSVLPSKTSSQGRLESEDLSPPAVSAA